MALGHGSIAECRAAVDSAEFTAWMAYDRLSPMGGERMDHLIAYLAWIIARTMGGAKRAKIADMLPRWPGENPPARDWRDLKSKVVILNKLFGGDDKRQAH